MQKKITQKNQIKIIYLPKMNAPYTLYIYLSYEKLHEK